MVKGGYDQMPDVYGAVISWVNDNGYHMEGTQGEDQYHQSGSHCDTACL